ncbi:SRPBCC family protein [Mesonia sp. K7]|uniref:SRPBCC family protein n=1 Tax=Mesonia sp. K7 TaxID=2218606 RepID=UPI000DA792B8|nr:SRPBCC family protein [Mesonia sp. K7]PZD78276.1 cell division protein [Mesonia sp. K7]
MRTIILETIINAPIERVFDLARSIDLHKLSTKGTNEEAIAGKTSGLIELGETVTWRAKHFGIYQNLCVVVTDYKKPYLFVDKMTKGAFSSMKHIHRFEGIKDNKTRMIDRFTFEAPLGFVGKIVESLFLESYMRKFLTEKNKELKTVAEGNEWQEILK